MRAVVIILFLLPFEASFRTILRQQVSKQPTKADQVLLAIREDALSAANQVIDELSDVKDLRSRVALAEKVVQCGFRH